MAGNLAAGTVAGTIERTPTASIHPGGSFRFDLATPEDDMEIRRLLRETPFEGDISVSLEREPDSALAAGIEGRTHQTIIARHQRSGRLAAVGSRSVRDLFVNGRPHSVGYLGMLRITRACAGRRSLMSGGFGLCRALHAAGDASFYLASIVDDNHAARRFLTESRLEGLPTFRPYAKLITLMLSISAFNLRSGSRRPRAVRVEPATMACLPAIAACLDRNGRRHQFAPCWTEEHLISSDCTLGLAPSDFLVATRDNEIIGCLARWDQRAYKQAVVRAYSPKLARWRLLNNIAATVVGTPRLPALGKPLALAYLSHIAVDGDDPEVLCALIEAARREAARDHLDYVAMGLAASNPMLSAVTSRFRPRCYSSMLYLAHWEDGLQAVASVDGRTPHVEVATL
jgi:hypothetical protein